MASRPSFLVGVPESTSWCLLSLPLVYVTPPAVIATGPDLGSRFVVDLRTAAAATTPRSDFGPSVYRPQNCNYYYEPRYIKLNTQYNTVIRCMCY